MKKSICLSVVVAVLLTGAVVWSQSKATGAPQGALGKSSDLLRLLRMPSPPAGAKVMNASGMLVKPANATHIYKFATADFPGASYSNATGTANGLVVGTFAYSSSSDAQAFTFKGGVYRTLLVPGSIASRADNVNSLGQIVGTFYDSAENATDLWTMRERSRRWITRGRCIPM